MKLINTKEAAAICGVHPITLKTWEANGKISSTKTQGGHRRWNVDEIKALKFASSPMTFTAGDIAKRLITACEKVIAERPEHVLSALQADCAFTTLELFGVVTKPLA